MLKGLGPALLINMSADWWRDISQMVAAGFLGPRTVAPQVFCLRKYLLPDQSSDLQWEFRKEWERAWALEEKL
jgi:hypothetical protein